VNKQFKELYIDVSEFDPPQPFEEVIELLKQLNQGEYIHMSHRKKPMPLLQFLETHGFSYIVKERPDIKRNEGEKITLWSVFIWHQTDRGVSNYCHLHFS